MEFLKNYGLLDDIDENLKIKEAISTLESTASVKTRAGCHKIMGIHSEAVGRHASLALRKEGVSGDWLDDESHGYGEFRAPITVPANYYTQYDKYKGDYLNGKRSGQGTYQYSNGDVYEGSWLHGVSHGLGCMRWIDGGVYSGEYRKDQLHGQGKMVYANDPKQVLSYEGSWANGLYHGLGTMTYTAVSGKKQQTGLWKKNKFVRAQAIDNVAESSAKKTTMATETILSTE
eukprot:gene27081-33753_t